MILKPARSRAALLLLPAALLLGGCYTVLKHPEVSDSELNTEPRAVGYANRCSSCHSDPELDAIEYRAHRGYYPDPAWAAWYWNPWWYDNYPHDPGGGGGGVSAPVGERREHGEGLDNRRPAVGPGVRVVPPGSVTEPAPPPKKDNSSGGDDKKDDSKKAPEKHDQGQSLPNPRPRP